MGKKLEVYPGMVVGGWEIKQEVEARSNHRRVIALCPSCKREKEVSLVNLTRGRSAHQCRSCAIAEINRKCKVKHGSLRDGVEAYKDYHILGNIVNRCHNPKNKDFPNYGGRGIIVEAPWRVNGHMNYTAFHAWYVASEQIAKTVYDKKYWDKLQVDRIDNDGNYSPENCRLVPPHVQHFNKRDTTYIDGVSLAEWYDSNKVMGSVSYTTFRTRVVRYKWDKERAISTPSKFPRTVREVISC